MHNNGNTAPAGDLKSAGKCFEIVKNKVNLLYKWYCAGLWRYFEGDVFRNAIHNALKHCAKMIKA